MPPITFRPAVETDLPVIITMLADDPLGKTREHAPAEQQSPTPAPAYMKAFQDIIADPNNHLIVAVAEQTPDSAAHSAVVGVLQLTFIPSLTYSGGMRAQVEGVRVHKDWRGHQIGHKLLQHAIARSEEKGCVLIQLTTDKARPDALRFYESLGFTPSHVGMKLRLRGT